MTEIKLALADPRVQLRALELAVERLASTPLQGAMQILTHLRDSIEEQVKPALEEPIELWSVIFANVPGSHFIEPKQLVRTTIGWLDADGNGWGDFASFSDVEVLRVGIGEPPEAEYHRGYEAGYGEGVNWGLAASRTPSHARFCTNSQNCRMADGHDGGCRVS